MDEERENKCQEIYLSALLISNFVGIAFSSKKKKIPSYEKVFGIKAQKQKMTDEQMYKQVLALNAAFGGSDKRGESNGSS